MPFFSIIIPIFNKEDFIKNTLNKVLCQSFQDFEVIIINDGSTDHSVEIIQNLEDSRIKIFNQDNKGVSAARNKGIELSNGKYICFLDADDEWEPDFLQTFFKTIECFKNYKVFSGAIKIDTGRRVIPALYDLKNPQVNGVFIENFFEASTKHSIIWTSCSVFNKTVFSISGLFDEAIRSGQDTDLWIRIGQHFEVVFVNKILAKYNFDEKSLSNSNFKNKIRFEKYKLLESQNPSAKRFLDLNRYSEIIAIKVHGNGENTDFLKKEIDYRNLNLKKKILLHTPDYLLKLFYKKQHLFIKLGLRKTFFK